MQRGYGGWDVLGELQTLTLFEENKLINRKRKGKRNITNANGTQRILQNRCWQWKVTTSTIIIYWCSVGCGQSKPNRKLLIFETLSYVITWCCCHIKLQNAIPAYRLNPQKGQQACFVMCSLTPETGKNLISIYVGNNSPNPMAFAYVLGQTYGITIIKMSHPSLTLSSYLTNSDPAHWHPSHDMIWYIDCRTKQVSSAGCITKEQSNAGVRHRDT